jgi:hypothetical protein
MYVKSALDQVSYDPASVWKSRTPKCRWAAELQLCTHIVDGRYFAGITTIDKIDELVDESRCDIAKDILDRLILDLDMPDSDRVLKNADTPGA